MITSMTGFGRAETEKNGRVLVAEIRTVNHRFLEISARLPRGLQFLESKVRALLQEKLTRGKVNLTLSWKGASDDGGEMSVDMGLARRYVDLLQQLRSEFDFREPVTLAQVVGLPDVLTWSEPDLPEDDAWALVKDCLAGAVRGLSEMREREGDALAKDLLARMDTIREGLAAVETRAPDRVREAKERLHNRVTELLAGEAPVDKDRLLVEAAFQAERMDCIEECVRLRSHVDQFEEMLREGGPVGRKLNFLTQEMNREANTIGSKANDSTIARHVIRLKEEVEIIREQIQNIE